MGIADADANALFATLAGLLHMSNFSFETGVPLSAAAVTPAKGSSASTERVRFSPHAAASVAAACELLGVMSAALETALTQREGRAGNEVFVTYLSLAQVSYDQLRLFSSHARLCLLAVHSPPDTSSYLLGGGRDGSISERDLWPLVSVARPRHQPSHTRARGRG